MAGSTGARSTEHSEPDLLGIYLNDHLAGATVGVELARRVAGANRSGEVGDALKRLTAEIVDDRAALLGMMAALDIPVQRYKGYAAWVGEKLGRLKLNGYVLRRSPLSIVVELEALRLAVLGKAAAWRTLRQLSERDPRLDAERLDGLMERARRQVDTLEELRVRKTSEVFGAASTVPVS